MTYEQAKELKDKGFPQQGGHSFGEHLHPLSGKVEVFEECNSMSTKIDFDSYVYIPTLSELIEACGEDFISLERHHPSIWSCLGDQGFEESGSTSEEAVMNLWKKLNE